MPPKQLLKQFVGVHIRRDYAEELARLALLNHRSLAGELRVAIENHLEQARAEESR